MWIFNLMLKHLNPNPDRLIKGLYDLLFWQDNFFAGLSGKKVAPLTNHRLEFVKTQLAGFERIQPAAAVDAAQQQQQQQPAATQPQDAGDQGSIYLYFHQIFLEFFSRLEISCAVEWPS
jgi:hypothetical protein